jgi:hypothetical protein
LTGVCGQGAPAVSMVALAPGPGQPLFREAAGRGSCEWVPMAGQRRRRMLRSLRRPQQRAVRQVSEKPTLPRHKCTNSVLKFEKRKSPVYSVSSWRREMLMGNEDCLRKIMHRCSPQSTVLLAGTCRSIRDRRRARGGTLGAPRGSLWHSPSPAELGRQRCRRPRGRPAARILAPCLLRLAQTLALCHTGWRENVARLLWRSSTAGCAGSR